jgi:nicotinamide mononucleotide (NMN) deamidase PncC
MTLKLSPEGNSTYTQVGVSCFYESEVQNSSFMHLMKFSAENRHLRKAAKRQAVKKLNYYHKITG